MHLVVFGGSGPTGQQVVRQALNAGHLVTATTRRPHQFPLKADSLNVVRTDVTDPNEVASAVAGAAAVISTYGVPYTRKPVTVYSTGISHIVDAMTEHGVSRLVCVSSTTVADEPAPGETFWWRAVIEPLLLRRVLGRTLYDDMEKMEGQVRASDLTWTIVRPAGLYDADEPGPYDMAPPRLRGRFTSRADLAQALLSEATDPQHPRATVDVVSRSQPPSALNFLREVTKIGT